MKHLIFVFALTMTQSAMAATCSGVCSNVRFAVLESLGREGARWAARLDMPGASSRFSRHATSLAILQDMARKSGASLGAVYEILKKCPDEFPVSDRQATVRELSDVITVARQLPNVESQLQLCE